MFKKSLVLSLVLALTLSTPLTALEIGKRIKESKVGQAVTGFVEKRRQFIKQTDEGPSDEDVEAEVNYRDPVFTGVFERRAKHLYRTFSTSQQRPLVKFAHALGMNYDPQDATILDLTNEKITDLSQMDSVLRELHYKIDAASKAKVTHLRLARNFIKEIPAHAFKDYPKLQAIDLGGNSITTIHPQAFSGLPELQAVILCTNKIEKELDATGQGISRDAFAGDSKLKFVSLASNPISWKTVRSLRKDHKVPIYKLGFNRHGLVNIIKNAGIYVLIALLVAAAIFIAYIAIGLAPTAAVGGATTSIPAGGTLAGGTEAVIVTDIFGGLVLETAAGGAAAAGASTAAAASVTVAAGGAAGIAGGVLATALSAALTVLLPPLIQSTWH